MDDFDFVLFSVWKMFDLSVALEHCMDWSFTRREYLSEDHGWMGRWMNTLHIVLLEAGGLGGLSRLHGSELILVEELVNGYLDLLGMFERLSRLRAGTRSDCSEFLDSCLLL
jgi:hypothetical protein